jgi:hypothetical protein
VAAPSQVTVDNLQPIIEYGFYGAVTAARAALPAMRDAREPRRPEVVFNA